MNCPRMKETECDCPGGYKNRAAVFAERKLMMSRRWRRIVRVCPRCSKDTENIPFWTSSAGTSVPAVLVPVDVLPVSPPGGVVVDPCFLWLTRPFKDAKKPYSTSVFLGKKGGDGGNTEGGAASSTYMLLVLMCMLGHTATHEASLVHEESCLFGWRNAPFASGAGVLR